MKINLYGTFYSVKHQVNAMLQSGGGSIVNTASGAGLEGSPNMTPYTASKHGIVGLTKSVALEYGKQNIRINAIAPGATITPAIEGWAKTILNNITVYWSHYLPEKCLHRKIKGML